METKTDSTNISHTFPVTQSHYLKSQHQIQISSINIQPQSFPHKVSCQVSGPTTKNGLCSSFSHSDQTSAVWCRVHTIQSFKIHFKYQNLYSSRLSRLTLKMLQYLTALFIYLDILTKGDILSESFNTL